MRAADGIDQDVEGATATLLEVLVDPVDNRLRAFPRTHETDSL
jgi:hypothetical protein